MRKLYTVFIMLLTMGGLYAQTVLYSNNFDAGAGDATIVGNGQLEAGTGAGFESVFHNAVGGQAIRSNYLLLPDNVFANLQAAATRELSIAFWVKKGTAIDYFWTPVFSAYAAAPLSTGNSWPMMVLQSRLVGQVNCGGWNDLVNADNVSGTNKESTTWLDDDQWHYYTATFTDSKVRIYVDGLIQNEWNTEKDVAGKTVSGLFDAGSELTYICLGGNQAWNWADPDPAYLFDDVAIYSSELTVEQINTNISAKTTTAIHSVDALRLISEEYFFINGVTVGNDFNALHEGVYIRKVMMSDGSLLTNKVMKKK
ncbi:MAG: LamG domain-containing protein [Paludibacteraceae bacterium]|nr:LamG domain-containing protein [Paludibacteraceae bacterium]